MSPGCINKRCAGEVWWWGCHFTTTRAPAVYLFVCRLNEDCATRVVLLVNYAIVCRGLGVIRILGNLTTLRWRNDKNPPRMKARGIQM